MDTVSYTHLYRQKLDEMGVAPSDIQTLEDVRKLPFTDKAVLRETFPFGLFAVPLDDIRELHSSSGTTGKPVSYTHLDVYKRQKLQFAQLLAGHRLNLRLKVHWLPPCP